MPGGWCASGRPSRTSGAASGPERISRFMKTFEGSMTALATPFREGALDEAAYRALVRQQLAGGTSVLLPMGTTGEAVTMSPEERFRAIRVVVEEAAGRVP